ncbi:MAG: choice-of-anchor E domain-containing protein [Planctomycetes bacterium]|nr:choice-of-anchor E domain-containing protein [Planctomycetota bacterium]
MSALRLLRFLAPLVLAAAATAAEVVHEFRLDAVAFGTNAALVAPRFDPALGVLRRVEFELSTRVQGLAGFENLGPGPAIADVSLQSAARVSLPDASVSCVAAHRADAQFALAGFDGQRDWAGSSGRLLPAEVTAFGASVVESGLAAYIANGRSNELLLPIHLRGGFQLRGEAECALRESWNVQVVVRLRYVYEPAS